MSTPSIALYTESHVIAGAVDPGCRISDYLNDPAVDYIELEDVTWYALGPGEQEPRTAGCATVRKDAVQLVVPKDAADPKAPRQATQRFAMELLLPQYSVNGIAHRRPFDPYSLTEFFGEHGRHFIPLTTATVCYLPTGESDGDIGTVLVNCRHLTFWALLMVTPALHGEPPGLAS